MTQGERLVWAAAYAKEFDLRNPPRECCLPKNDAMWREWEESQVHQAIELACCAVAYMRRVRGDIQNGYGKDSDVAQMLDDILEGEVA